MAKPGRNDRCPCGSGKKYKACCLTKDDAVEQQRITVRRTVPACQPFLALTDV
jgi:SEC-C motif